MAIMVPLSSSDNNLTTHKTIIHLFLLIHLAPDRRIWAFHQACNGKRTNDQYVDGNNGQHESHRNHR